MAHRLLTGQRFMIANANPRNFTIHPSLLAGLWIHRSRHCYQRKNTLSSDAATFPSSAEIVVAGAGVIGSSVAYHLAKYGKKDVVVLEQGSLGCGTTWHAVGLLGLLRASTLHYKMSAYSLDLYSELEKETGLGTGVKLCGSVAVAKSKDRAKLLRRVFDRARQNGVECEMISPREALELYPLLKIDDLELAVWSPNEGACNASDACASLMRGATNKGVRFIQGVGVKNVATDGKRVTGVDTDHGFIHCDKFVNCAGQWARELGLRSDTPVHLPLHSCEHFYIVTKPMPGVHSMLPVLRDGDSYIYIREWSGGLMAGGFEPQGKPCFYEKGVPHKFEFQLLPEDWDHFDILMQGMIHRIPSIANAEIRQFVNGPESFTEDGGFLLGEVPEVHNYFVAAGMNSSGIASGPAMGKLTAELIAYGKSSWDITSFDVKRFSKEQNNKFYLRNRAGKILGRNYSMQYPDTQISAGGPLKTSPLYDVLSQNGCQWSKIGGWERARWFSPDGKDSIPTFGKPNWIEWVGEEYKACKESVGLADMTWQSKVEISSDSASQLVSELQFLFAENIDIKTGTFVNASLLNEDGNYVATAILYRIADNRYFCVTSPIQQNTLLWWIRKNCKSADAIKIDDVSSKYACLGLFGPKSDELIKQLTLTPLDDFAKGEHQYVDLGNASDVLLCRGFLDDENNWQAFVPSELCRGLYKNFVETGKVKDVGHTAINTLRIEAGLPEFGTDFGATTSPMEIGRFSVEKDCDFIGKKALQNKGFSSDRSLFKLVIDDVDDDNWAWGGEPVEAAGESMGNLSSVAFSFSKKALVAYAIFDKAKIDNADSLVVRIAGRPKSCRII
ncbi:pyruvate dehydrogenase phosphatase regulatory subunit, mitochondrial-like isoform X1 [Rhopilema esculentum]|uniref:pyruvate dehydrogenase phosphatase regulatory subunit, mitochondrial-like isoform X1 n=1 Tax=Rhopilema esculentum TaxID=499914 RepID=UPI0031E47971|eukprot:gene1450-15875_t